MEPDQEVPDPEREKERRWQAARDALTALRPPNNRDTFDPIKFQQYDRKVRKDSHNAAAVHMASQSVQPWNFPIQAHDEVQKTQLLHQLAIWGLLLIIVYAMQRCSREISSVGAEVPLLLG